ncbi:MAG TPA: aldo/keto reductase [Bryobacteraceae bacterium]|jgi:aryl-alcohol dehydrogenase-like predicted oxidoreductase
MPSPAARQVLATTSYSSTGMPTRMLGRTGVPVSIMGIGGWHIGAITDDAEAIRIMHTAFDEGITFWDNAWDYHDGRSEQLMGKALKGKRDQIFLMTKNCERDYKGSLKNLDDSLKRLKTDHLDLWQFHEMVYDNDPDWIFDKGAVKAALEAKKAGKIRFLGFTGHKAPWIHLDLLKRDFEWDTAQMSLNLVDVHYRSFQKQVVPTCLKKGVGIIGMKGLGGGYPDGRILARTKLTVEECYSYALSLPLSTLVMGINTMEHLKQDIALVRNFKPLNATQMAELEARYQGDADDGRFELYKSTSLFDGPHHRKQHGFPAAGG